MDKKITFFINSFRGGGTEKTCVTLANSLIDCGWDIDIIVLNLNNAVLQTELNNKILLTVLNVSHTRSVFFKLIKYLYIHKPKKIFAFNHQLAVLLTIVRSIFRFNYQIIARNSSTLSKKNNVEKSFWHKYIVNRIVLCLYRNVDKIIAQSNGMENDLINNYKIPQNKTVVINNPINPAIEYYLKNSSLENYKKKYLLCVGRLESVKAFHYAISAFARIKNDYKELRLKIVGKGILEKDLKNLASEIGVLESVDFEGFKKDLIPYYLGAKATILTSIYEGFPNVLVESISLGTPVVAFDCPCGPNEIIINGVNGFLVRYQDVDHFDTSLRATLDMKWQTSKIIDTAFRFSSQQIIKKYVQTLS
jgi:glycosyltransferase involved in cell wall biosynthesis